MDKTTTTQTHTKQFDSEKAATAYWNSIGATHRGGQVVQNELEYKRDGSFEVITVVRS